MMGVKSMNIHAYPIIIQPLSKEEGGGYLAEAPDTGMYCRW